MGSTLSSLRQNGLNLDLGLATDNDNRFGTSTQRNYYLTVAFRRLWPQMGRLIVEEIPVVEATKEYDLDAIRDVERIDILEDASGLVVGRVPTWRVLENEESDPPALQLLVPELATEQTMRVIGYAPYTVPLVDADTSELPVDLEYIVVTGGRAEAYRGRLNQFVDYTQNAAANRSTSITSSELRDLWFAAKAEFEQLMNLHRRRMSGVRRARLTTEG